MTDAALPSAAGPARPAPPLALGGDGAALDWTRLYLGFAGMVLGQFMAMLDIQIVAASLVQIQAGIGATSDEISWIQTIYLLAEVLTMPLTAYMTKMWGTRPFYLVAVVGFIVTSLATGLATSVTALIGFRFVQGLFAGALIPPVMAVAMGVFPPERRLSALVVVSLVISLAPTIGPTLGGHLTDALNWRWLFFINAPVGAVVIFLVWRYGDFDRPDPTLSRGVDWFGFGLMVVFLLSLQYVIEEGARAGWFASDLILWLSVSATLTGAAFIWRQLTYRQPIVSLEPFKDRNFVLGFLMQFVTGATLFGSTFLLPVFLGQVRGYSASEVGVTMLVTGLTMFLFTPLAGRLVRIMEARMAMILGFALTAWSLQAGVRVTGDWGYWQFFGLQVGRGVGSMLAMIASQQLCISTLSASQMKDASGLLNLIRNIAGAVGLAVLTTVLGHQTAVHYMDLASAVSVANPTSQAMYGALSDMMTASGMADPEATARSAFARVLHRQATVLGFADAFALLALGSWFAVLLAVFAKSGRVSGTGPGGGH